MAVKIRLSRIGKKNAPMYRIVAIDEHKARDGKYLDNLGTYNPLQGTFVQFHEDRIKNWIAKGAQPTDSFKKIYRVYRKRDAA